MAINTKEDLLYQTYLPPPEMSKWASFWMFVWNSEKEEFLGRSGRSWLKVIGFYIALYIFLAGFFLVMLKIFLSRLPYDRPQWILEESLIGTNPGMGFRPKPKHPDSALIWFKAGKRRTYDYWTEHLDEFLIPYNENITGKRTHCSWSDRGDESLPCLFDVSQLGSCTNAKQYGYDQSQPCVFVKLNRIWGWNPEPYLFNDPSLANLPTNVQKLVLENKAKPSVWITCEGESPTDKENAGPMSYYPKLQGFPDYYFPFKNDVGYLSPFVAIQFKKLTPGFLINIECKAWAKNIEHIKTDTQAGLVRFEILMD